MIFCIGKLMWFLLSSVKSFYVPEFTESVYFRVFFIDSSSVVALVCASVGNCVDVLCACLLENTGHLIAYK